MRVAVLAALLLSSPAHAGGPGAVEEKWASYTLTLMKDGEPTDLKCEVPCNCEQMAQTITDCKNALTKRVPCDSCCGEEEPCMDCRKYLEEMTTVLDVPSDSPGADNGGAVNSRAPTGEASPAGSQPGAPDSNGERWSNKDAVLNRDAGSTPARSATWHPAAGLSLLSAAYLGHLGAEHRGPRVHWLILGTLGRMHSDGETVETFVPKHPNDYGNGCEYGCNDYAPAGTREAGGGSDTLWGATGIATW